MYGARLFVFVMIRFLFSLFCKTHIRSKCERQQQKPHGWRCVYFRYAKLRIFVIRVAKSGLVSVDLMDDLISKEVLGRSGVKVKKFSVESKEWKFEKL